MAKPNGDIVPTHAFQWIRIVSSTQGEIRVDCGCQHASKQTQSANRLITQLSVEIFVHM